MSKKLDYHFEEQLMTKQFVYDQLGFELMFQLLDSISLLYHHQNQKLSYYSEEQLMP